MYIPPYYKIENPELTRQFIAENNFGMLMCNGDLSPLVTHLPFYSIENSGEFMLFTHLAKANPQWNQLEKSRECLVVFSGPHGYVSPSLYSSPQNVPTWNYMSVHVTGVTEVIHDDNEKRLLMHETIQGAEKEFQKQYDTLAANYLDAMYKAIVFVKISVRSIETKFKLSQNKPEQDIRKVADKFEADGNKALAVWMRRMNKL